MKKLSLDNKTPTQTPTPSRTPTPRTPRPPTKVYVLIVRKNRKGLDGFFPNSIDQKGNVITGLVYGVGRRGADPERAVFIAMKKATSYDSVAMGEFKLMCIHRSYDSGESYWIAVTSRKTPRYAPTDVLTGNHGWITYPLDSDYIEYQTRQRGWKLSPHVDKMILHLREVSAFWGIMADSLDRPVNNEPNMRFRH